MNIPCNVAAVAMIFAISILCRADETDSLPTKGIENVRSLNRVYNRLVRNTASEKLRDLRTGDDVGVALQAAWEDVRRQTRIPHTAEDERRNLSRINLSSTERFLAFMEGRLSVRVPDWWEELLKRARLTAYANGNVFMSVSPKKHELYYNREVAVGVDEDDVLRTPNRIDSISQNHDKWTVSIGEAELVISQLPSKPWGLNAVSFDDHRWIVAMHSAGFADYPLVCIDADSRNEVWRAGVWGEYQWFVKSGAGFFHWVDFRKRKDTIYVFGALNNAFYVEGFSLSDGTNQFRFSTSYCFEVNRKK